MKRVISTKVDQATYAEFLEYCARVNKYPANALRDALELLLRSDGIENERKPKVTETEKTQNQHEPQPDAKPKPKIESDEDEDELDELFKFF